MIQYSGGTLINRTFNPTSRGDWCNNITQAMSDAGWSTISGVPGSGSDVLMATAAPLFGVGIRCRIFDPGSGNCAQATIKNAAGTFTSQIAYCLHSTGSGQWRVWANKFHVFAFATGTANRTAQRGTFSAGTLWIPSWLNIQPTDPLGYLTLTGTTDTDASNRVSWRSSIRCSGMYWSGVYQANVINGVGFGSDINGCWSIPFIQGCYYAYDGNYRWIDGVTLEVSEPLVAWASGAASTNEAKFKGQLYDAIVVSGQWAGETIFTFDGHNWLVVTDGPTTGQACTQVLALAIT